MQAKKGSDSSGRNCPFHESVEKRVLFIDLDLINVFEILPNNQLFIQTDDDTDIFFDQKAVEGVQLELPVKE